MADRNQSKTRTHDEVRELRAQIEPLTATPYTASGKAGFGQVTAIFSGLPEDIDTMLFYGFATHAPLMVRELLAQLDALMGSEAVAS